MMDSVVRGFIIKIELGRGGLVSITVLLTDGSTRLFVILDLDADPERYNERLSKLAIARDAMNRAEPVEIRASASDSGQEIDTIARVTRDELDDAQSPTSVEGLVLGVGLQSFNTVMADGELHDIAEVKVVTDELTLVTLQLDMQIPERLVAAQQLEIIRDAQAHGDVLRFLVDSANAKAQGDARILAVIAGLDNSPFGRDGNSKTLDGFVESLGLIRLPPGTAGMSNLAYVRFTTAPAFTGSGNAVGTAPFTPVTVNLVVPKASETYGLLEVGLRDNLRMRVAMMALNNERKATDNPQVAVATPAGVPRQTRSSRTSLTPASSPTEAPRVRMFSSLMTSDIGTTDTPNIAFALAAELLAPLASASRPVWITISRELLDRSPETVNCSTGVPSSDLNVLTLRDLRIPYPAVWDGLGCFNEGVYRFQLQLKTDFKLFVDGKELCLYDSDQEGIKMAYACLCGDHHVCVELDAWTCDDEFLMDVYRLR